MRATPTWARTALAFLAPAILALPAPLATPQAHAATSVGIVAAVNQTTTGTPPNASVRQIEFGVDIIFGELIETSEIGVLQILLADGTTFTIGPSSQISIDSFVYDPDAGTASVGATFAKGTLRFIGGIASQRDGGVKINTSIGTVGVRGAILDVKAEADTVICTPEFASLTTIETRDGTVVTLEGTGTQFNGDVRTGNVVVEAPPPGQAATMNATFGGLPGQTGGAPQSVTSELVQASGLPQTAPGPAAQSPDQNPGDLNPGSSSPASAQ